MTIEFLTLPDRRLAYQRLRGRNSAPQIAFFGGYAADMAGTKAGFLAERCRAAGYGFLRFDYRGHGKSPGVFRDCVLGDWLDDARAALTRLTEGPQIVIGSSMGGWLGLALAKEMPERFKAFIGIAAGPDFTEDLIWDRLSEAQRVELRQTGWLRDGDEMTDNGPNPDANIVTLKLIEEARSHLLLRSPLPVSCPVRLLQGMRDDEVPWQTAPKIAAHVAAADARVILIKDGDHRLSRAQDLAVLWEMVGEFV